MVKFHESNLTLTLLAIVGILSGIGGFGNFLINAHIVQATAYGVAIGDGYTLIGSSQKMSNYTQTPISWKTDYFSYQRTGNCPTTGAFYPLTGSTDQKLTVGGGNIGGTCEFNDCTTILQPFNRKKIRVDLTYTLSASSKSQSHMNIKSNDGTVLFSDSFGSSSQYPSHTSSLLVESVPHLLDSQTDILVGGQLKKTITPTQDFSLTFCGLVDANSGVQFIFNNLRYQPILGCQNDPTDAIVEQTFTGGQTITLDSFRYPVKSFCYSNPIEIIRGNNSGISFDGSIEVFSALSQAEAVNVPSGDTWTVRYSIDNSKGIISTSCGSGNAYDLNKQSCVPLVLALTEGTLNTDTNTFTITPKVVCEEKLGIKATWNDQTQQCVLNQPVLEYCNPNNNECSLQVSKVCTSAGLTYNSQLQRCESKSTVTEKPQNQPLFTTWTWIFLGLFIVSLFAFLILLGMRRKRR